LTTEGLLAAAEKTAPPAVCTAKLAASCPSKTTTAWYQPILNTLAKNGIHNYSLFESGVYAKMKESSFFISTPAQLPDWTRQYWVMVKILSEKYGCFMTNKQRSGNRVTFRCRDNRLVVFESFQSKGFIYFRGNQYDGWGNQLYVKNHNVIKLPPKEDLVFE
jgi:hypothetical protein